MSDILPFDAARSPDEPVNFDSWKSEIHPIAWDCQTIQSDELFMNYSQNMK